MPAKKLLPTKATRSKKAEARQRDRELRAKQYDIPAGYQEVSTAAAFWKPEKDGENVTGSYSRSYMSRDKNGGEQRRYVLDIGGGEELILPGHVTLLAGMSKVPLNAAVYIVCVHVGSPGREDFFEYKVAFMEVEEP